MKTGTKLYNTEFEEIEAEVISKDERIITLLAKDNSTGEIETVVCKKWEMKYYWTTKKDRVCQI